MMPSLTRILTAITVSSVVLTTAIAPLRAESDDPVVLARGEHRLTLSTLDARMERLPPHERAQFARDPANLARVMDRLLIDSLLAAEARQLGIDQEPAVRRDLELAMQEVLAIHRMNRLFAPENLPDFSLLARERYLADPAAHQRPERLVVEHVLIGTRDRSEHEAREIAERVAAEATRHPDRFMELVLDHSEDPSKGDNRGRFVIEDDVSYHPEFTKGARALQAPNSISPPVQTSFGFHVIRLVERVPAQELSFEEVKDALERQVEIDFRDTVRADYLAQLRSRYPETGDEALLLSLPARYGGRPELPQ